MEIIAEVLLGLMQVGGELLLQLVFEVFGGLALRSLGEPFRRREPINPVFAAVGYTLFGAMAGGISLWIAPSLFIETEWLRVLNLIATPMAAGVLMAALGAWRRRRGEGFIRLDRFGYGFLFALAMAGVRFVWGR